MVADIHFIDLVHERAGNEASIHGLGGLIKLAVRQFGDRNDAVDKLRVAQNTERLDAASPGNGYHLARDLEHRYGEILREPHPVPNGLALFPIDSSVPVGAEWHTIRRVYQAGRAAPYRGRGSDIKRVSVSSREERFKISTIATSFETDMFEMAADAMSGMPPIQPELVLAARDATDSYLNFQTWYGSTDSKLPGVINYPWLRKKVISVAFNGDNTTLEVLAALHDLVDFSYLKEKQRFQPDRLVMSPRLHKFISQTPMSIDNSKTIKQMFLEETAFISSIEQAWELQNDDSSHPLPGVPTGLDCMLAYRGDRMGIQNTIPQGFTMLAPQRDGFADVTLCWARHGGVIMREVGNNILGFVTPKALGSLT